MTSHWLLRQAGLSSIWKKWSINAEFNLSLLVLTLRRALLRARTGSLLRWWSPPWRSSYFISAGFHIYYITTRINNKESFNYMNHFLCYLLISLTLSDTIWHCLILSDTIWYYLTIYDTVWHDLILSDIIWYCLTLSDTRVAKRLFLSGIPIIIKKCPNYLFDRFCHKMMHKKKDKIKLL